MPSEKKKTSKHTKRRTTAATATATITATEKVMFETELDRAGVLLGCNLLAFVSETAVGFRVRSVVSTETLYFCAFYYLAAFRASRHHRLHLPRRSLFLRSQQYDRDRVYHHHHHRASATAAATATAAAAKAAAACQKDTWAELVRIAACLVPASTLVSFLGNLYRAVIECTAYGAVVDAPSRNDDCNVGGSAVACNTFVQMAKSQRVLDGCPTFALGQVLGAIHVAVIVLFRLLPCLALGTTFAVTFDERRLWSETPDSPAATTTAAAAASGSVTASPTDECAVVPVRFLIVTSTILWALFALEVGSVQAAKISSRETLVVYFAVLLLQLCRARRRRRRRRRRRGGLKARGAVSTTSTTATVASPAATTTIDDGTDGAFLGWSWVASRLLVFYVYLDALGNGVQAFVGCTAAERDAVSARCPSADARCLERVRALRPAVSFHYECRRFAFQGGGDDDADAAAGLFYLSQLCRFAMLGIVYPIALYCCEGRDADDADDDYGGGHRARGRRGRDDDDRADEFLVRSAARYDDEDELDRLLQKAALMHMRDLQRRRNVVDDDALEDDEDDEYEEVQEEQEDTDDVREVEEMKEDADKTTDAAIKSATTGDGGGGGGGGGGKDDDDNHRRPRRSHPRDGGSTLRPRVPLKGKTVSTPIASKEPGNGSRLNTKSKTAAGAEVPAVVASSSSSSSTTKPAAKTSTSSSNPASSSSSSARHDGARDERR